MTAKAAKGVESLLGPDAAKHEDPRRLERDLDQARLVADGQRTAQAAMLEQAAQRIEGELEALKGSDRDALVAELRADDEAVQQQVEAALRAVPKAPAAWRAQERRHEALLPEHVRRTRPIEDPQLHGQPHGHPRRLRFLPRSGGRARFAGRGARRRYGEEVSLPTGSSG